MKTKTLFIFLSFIIFVVISAQSSEESKVLTPEMVSQLKTVSSVHLSPDGERIAFRLSVPRGLEEKSGSSYTEVYMMPFSGGEPFLFLSRKGSPSSLIWSKDSKKLFFSARRDGKQQVWCIPTDGGEAKKITEFETGISAFKLSPDESKLACLVRDDYTPEEKKAKKAGLDMNEVEKHYRFSRIHVMDLASKETKAVTPAEYEVRDFNWSPDGSKFVITATDEATTDAGYMFKKLFIVDASSGERKLLCKTEGKLGEPVWSPDGKFIAWNGAVDISDGASGSLFVCHVDEGKAENLTDGYIGTVTGVQWLKTNKILFTAIEFQDSICYEIAVDGTERKQLLGPGPIFRNVSLSADEKKLATSANTATNPNEVYVAEVGKSLEKLTDHNPVLQQVKLGKQEVIEWTAKDGWKIQGVLVYPVDYEAGQRYPLIVNPHGGPESTDMNGWNTRYSKWAQTLAGEGYFVFMPNYRASTGRGVAFVKANHQDLGGKEFQDVIDGIDYLVEKGMVDKDRVGSGGGSYGGYFSAIAATKWSHRFAASVVFAGPSSQYSKIGTTDTTWENALVHYDLPQWWKEHEKIWSFSPVAYVDNAQTPTLICHGENDKRVPLGQGIELFRNIKARGGVPVELVIYPRAGHGLRESQHRLDYNKRAIEWFNKHVKNKKIDKEKLD